MEFAAHPVVVTGWTCELGLLRCWRNAPVVGARRASSCRGSEPICLVSLTNNSCRLKQVGCTNFRQVG